MPLFYVKVRKNIDICNYLPIYYPAICRGWGTFSVLSLGRDGEGLQRGFESSYTLLYIYAREVSAVTVMTALTFVGTNGGGC